MEKAVLEARQANERFRRLYERSGPAVAQLEELESKLEKYQSEVLDLNNQIAQLVVQIGERDDAIVAREQQLAEAEVALNQLKEQLGHQISPAELETAKQQVHQLQSQLVSQMEQIQTLQQNEAGAWEQIGQFRAELHQAQERLQVELRAQEDHFAHERAHLNEQISLGQAALQQSQAQQNQLNQQLASLQNQIALLPAQEDLDRALSEITQLKQRLAEAESSLGDNESHQRQLEDLHLQLNHTAQEREQLRAQLEGKELELAELRTNLETLRETQEQAGADFDQLELEALRRSLEDANRERQRVEDERDALQLKLDEGADVANEDLEHFEREIARLREELSQPTDTEELEKLRRENERLRDELIDKNAQFMAPNDEETDPVASSGDLDRQLREAHEQANQFRNQALLAESEILNLERQRQEMEEQLAHTSETYESELRNAQEALSSLKEEMENAGSNDEKIRTVERRAELFEEKMLEFEDRARQAEKELSASRAEVEQLNQALSQQPAAPTAEVDHETARLAFEDTLTRLPNINILNRYLGMTTKQVAQNEGSLAVLVVDLDKFRLANDTLGHKLGDELLFQVGQRLDAVVERPDVLGRRGEDEFIIVVFVPAHDNASAAPSGHTPAANRARGLAGKIMNGLRKPFSIENHSIHLTASIGISLYPGDATSGGELVEHADSAMYNAKDSGRARTQFYTPELHRFQEERARMISELHQAIARKEFRLMYQPMVDLRKGRIEGLEALLRWQHPTRGLLEPHEFLEIAEESGLIISIGDWVAEEACRLISQFRNKAFVSINVSPRQLMQANFARRFMKAVEKARIRPDRVVVEINEADKCLENNRIREVLAELNQWSVGIGLDDFGTGSTSVGRLREANIRFIKIANHWTAGLPQDRHCAGIVKGAIGLSTGLGMASLAEGVESAEQLKALKSFGCQMAQGFFLSPPVEVNAVNALMKKTFKI